MAEYNDKLDPDEQITMEEQIASIIWAMAEVHEETAQELSREILRVVLEKFRPDFFV